MRGRRFYLPVYAQGRDLSVFTSAFLTFKGGAPISHDSQASN
jgi:hypothetical protein